MRKNLIALLLVAAIAAFFIGLAPAAHANTVYVGIADLADGVQDGQINGSTTFAFDRLVVTVNNQGGQLVCQNHWIGIQHSGMNWQYTLVWSGTVWTLVRSQGVVKYSGLPPAVHLWVVK